MNNIVTEKGCLIWVLHVNMIQLPRRFLDPNIVCCWILISFCLMEKALSEKTMESFSIISINNGKVCHCQWKNLWKVLPLSVKEAERLVIITKQWERLALWGWTGYVEKLVIIIINGERHAIILLNGWKFCIYSGKACHYLYKFHRNIKYQYSHNHYKQLKISHLSL